MRTLILGMLAMLGACNAALDFDALQKGEAPEEDDTSTRTGCTSAADCDDGIECTSDKCNAKGKCSHNPSNDLCPGFEVCRRDEGCVDLGRECLLDSDCDDDVDCTKDYCHNDGTCRHTADDGLCEDSDNLCVEGMVCDATLGCTGGFEKQCRQEDETSCYNIFCDPKTGECDLREPKPGADDDGDGYCDGNSEYDGNDCLDNDKDIHPGAAEVCDLLDNDCDGLEDGTIVSKGRIHTAAAISAPSLAFGDGRYLVTWQEGDGENAHVRLRLLGEGACLVESDCTDDTLQAASEIVDFTAKGGEGMAGEMPKAVFADGGFHLVWVSTDGEIAKVVRSMVTLTENEPEVMTADVWSDDQSAVRDIDVSPSGNGVIAVWGAVFSSGKSGLRLSMDGAATSSLDTQNDIVGAVAIDCLDDTACVVAFDQMSDGDREVFAGQVTLSESNVFEKGWSTRMSESSKDVGDPSIAPRVTWMGGDRWAVAFTDVKETDTGFEEDSDIRGSLGDAVLDLLTDGIGQHAMGGLVFDGDWIDLLFVNDVQGDTTLQVAMFDETFSRVANQRTELFNGNDGELAVSPLLSTAGTLSLAWVFTPTEKDAELTFVTFEPCDPEK